MLSTYEERAGARQGPQYARANVRQEERERKKGQQQQQPRQHRQNIKGANRVKGWEKRTDKTGERKSKHMRVRETVRHRECGWEATRWVNGQCKSV